MLTLRQYQNAAIEKILWILFKAFNPGYIIKPILEAPTGSGKSLIQAELCRLLLKQNFAHRILCVTHVQELIEQNFLELMGHWQDAPAGINCAGLKSRDYYSSIIFASVQSIYKNVSILDHIDYVLIDECHLCPVKTSTGQYRTLIDGLISLNPKIRIIGFTATHYRLDNGLLTEGKNRLFTDIITARETGMEIDDLIDQRFLTPLITQPVSTIIRTDGVRMNNGGDYVLSQLAKKVDQDPITTACVNETVMLGQNRRCWLVFGCSKLHCIHIKEKLDSFGIQCAIIDDDTPKAERKRLIADHKAGRLRCLININILTTGYNNVIDLIVFMRPTKSKSLYVQKAGRGSRIDWSWKENCLVLDFAGLIQEHGPVNNLKPHKKKGGGFAPQKLCPDCDRLNHLSAKKCKFCPHVFYELDPFYKEPEINTTSSDLDIITPRVTYSVKQCMYSMHEKEGKPDQIRAIFVTTENKNIVFYLRLFHGGIPQEISEKWYKQFVNPQIDYDNAEQALFLIRVNGSLPAQIEVDETGKYPNIKKFIPHEKMAKAG